MFEGKIDKRSLAFLDILIRKGREEQVHDIAQQFYESYLDHKNIAVVEITTATAIDEALSRKMLQVMEARTQKTIQMQQKLDPEMIGGYKLKMQDYQYDASISKVISRLHKEFDKNLFIKGF